MKHSVATSTLILPALALALLASSPMFAARYNPDQQAQLKPSRKEVASFVWGGRVAYDPRTGQCSYAQPGEDLFTVVGPARAGVDSLGRKVLVCAVGTDVNADSSFVWGGRYMFVLGGDGTIIEVFATAHDENSLFVLVDESPSSNLEYTVITLVEYNRLLRQKTPTVTLKYTTAI